MIKTMPLFTLNLALMLVWASFTADFSWNNLALGFIVGWAALWFTRLITGRPLYVIKPLKAASLLAYYLSQLFVSSLQVTWEIITPGQKSTPGIICIPLDVKTEFQILLFSDLIAAIPGTLPLDITDDRSKLYVHVMFLDDPDQAGRELKEKLEQRIIELTS